MSLETLLKESRERFEDELAEFLAIPSVSARSEHKDDMTRCAEWVSAKLGELGMKAEVLTTPGHPIVYGELMEAGPDAPTVLVYGHYDVQPVEPLDEWESPPFEATVRDGNLYARGTADDKGQIHIHMKALEAYREAKGTPPLNLKLLFEGEEEVGSVNLEDFVNDNVERLACDAAVISDTPMLAPDLPSVCVGLRGMVYMEVGLKGPRQDLHSGQYGGAVVNPANALARIIAQLKDDEGRISIPGFYDAVKELTAAEKKALSEIPVTEEKFAEEAGVSATGDGEAGVHWLERIWARPTLDVNGLLSGYTGEGAKTIIPATAMAKVSMRLVPDQDPKAVRAAFEDYVRSLAPDGVEMTVQIHADGMPWGADPEGPLFRAASAAIDAVFDREPLFIREGGSIPIVPMIEKVLDTPVLLLGFALPGCNLHSPNEWISLDLYHKGIDVMTRLYDEIAQEYAS
ncbi:MAG: dipeptidase [Gemmatimonadetes bacterium]|uniref:Dipeptidase n=1 Tax=Candidatus Kutchimonas denitrificans TaxID=3056748 RepID=A0AAE4Z712_9BACT|nr:dipeptidase [Gemmatimonadota bacterium]NIR74919.1 dipeptidase [Candidatus Kutchimonas denitrificans]NIS00031.1 dipeptidase [Gemmatimonadota bacterium]NIT65614.1 dipeptidase [Gemmatimonadota bacterium]NIU52584.1 dipeptidase [Gemmatimonadota bacterium]